MFYNVEEHPPSIEREEFSSSCMIQIMRPGLVASLSTGRRRVERKKEVMRVDSHSRRRVAKLATGIMHLLHTEFSDMITGLTTDEQVLMIQPHSVRAHLFGID